MFSELDALVALAELGTMTRAAQRLRVTQSAVSKRIAALSDTLGVKLVQRDGRRVRLTPAAQRLLARARPLLAELRGTISEERSSALISVGVSDSILASWGAAALYQAAGDDIRLDVAAHRSPLVLERVRAGEMMLALCAGELHSTPELIQEASWREPLVIVPAGNDASALNLTADKPTEVITIERASATWRALKSQLAVLAPHAPLMVTREVQSFSCILQMALAGFGHGLVPLGLAITAKANHQRLPPPGLSRPVALIGRPTTLARPAVVRFCQALRHQISLALTSYSAAR